MNNKENIFKGFNGNQFIIPKQAKASPKKVNVFSSWSDRINQADNILKGRLSQLDVRLERLEKSSKIQLSHIEDAKCRVDWVNVEIKDNFYIEACKSPCRVMKQYSEMYSFLTSIYETKDCKSKNERLKVGRVHQIADNIMQYAEKELREGGEVEERLGRYFRRENRSAMLRRKKVLRDIQTEIKTKEEEIKKIEESQSTSKKRLRGKSPTGTPAKKKQYSNVLQDLNKSDTLELDMSDIHNNENIDVNRTFSGNLVEDTRKNEKGQPHSPQRKYHENCYLPVNREPDEVDYQIRPEEDKKLSHEEFTDFILRNYTQPIEKQAIENQENLKNRRNTNHASYYRLTSEERREIVQKMISGEIMNHQKLPEKMKFPEKYSSSPKKESLKNFIVGKYSSIDVTSPDTLKRSLSPEERHEKMKKYLDKEMEFDHMICTREEGSSKREGEKKSRAKPRGFTFGMANIIKTDDQDGMPRSLSKTQRSQKMKKYLVEGELFNHQKPPSKKKEESHETPSKQAVKRKNLTIQNNTPQAYLSSVGKDIMKVNYNNKSVSKNKKVKGTIKLENQKSSLSKSTNRKSSTSQNVPISIKNIKKTETRRNTKKDILEDINKNIQIGHNVITNIDDFGGDLLPENDDEMILLPQEEEFDFEDMGDSNGIDPNEIVAADDGESSKKGDLEVIID